MSFPDAVTRDLYYYEKSQTEYQPPRCPECYQECDTLYTWKDSGYTIECDSRIDRHYTDNEGFEDFECPNGCRLDPEYSETVYTWHGSGEPVGCQHCISERDIHDWE